MIRLLFKAVFILALLLLAGTCVLRVRKGIVHRYSWMNPTKPLI